MAARKSKQNDFNQRESKENEQETSDIFGASDWGLDDMNWELEDLKDWSPCLNESDKSENGGRKQNDKK